MLLVFDDQNARHRSDVRCCRKLKRERAAVSGAFTLGPRATAVLLRDRAHDKKPEPCALHSRCYRPRDAVEALPDPLELSRRNADPAVTDADCEPARFTRRDSHLDIHVAG